jgi:dienelactone hydrolase
MSITKPYRYGPSTPVRIPLEITALQGDLSISPDSGGLVIFVHGSGSSRFSPRNRHVAEQLNKHGLATLLLDLLTDDENAIDSETMQYRFDIPMLADRTKLVVSWVRKQPGLDRLPIGLFGASTGAAAALITAAAMPGEIAAVVSRGGRPDLAKNTLKKVQAPTLLIVGGKDRVVIDLNEKALKQMRCIRELKIIPWATHLFEEPGAMEQVADAASSWFLTYLQSSQPRQKIAG